MQTRHTRGELRLLSVPNRVVRVPTRRLARASLEGGRLRRRAGETMTAEPRITEFLSDEPTADRDAGEVSGEGGTDGTREGDGDGDHRLEPDAPAAQRLVQPSPRQQNRHRGTMALRADRPEERLLALLEAISRRIRKQPFGALAIAIGAGFILGGALSSRAGRALVSAGARHVGRELLKQLL